MGKMFYTVNETKNILGRSDEDIQQYMREGKLRQLLNGQEPVFKAKEVDSLKSELASGPTDHVDLGTADSGMGIALVDSKGGSSMPGMSSGGTAAGLTLEDTEPGHRSGAGMVLKDETALSTDLGLSGSVGGMPSPSRINTGPSGSGAASALSGSQAPRGGIDIFQSDDIERVDPSAQTAVGGGQLGVAESLNTESIGSGSGLLDLTRESDDTSLGAELLDEIAPGSSKAGGTGIGGSAMGGTGIRKAGDSNAGASGTVSGALSDSRNIGPGIGRATQVSAITEIEKADPMSGAFAGLALGAVVVAIFGIFALITGILDTAPPIMVQIKSYGMPIIAGAGLGVAVVCFVGGLLIGKIAK